MVKGAITPEASCLKELVGLMKSTGDTIIAILVFSNIKFSPPDITSFLQPVTDRASTNRSELLFHTLAATAFTSSPISDISLINFFATAAGHSFWWLVPVTHLFKLFRRVPVM